MKHSVKMVEEENERIIMKCQSSENANIGERAGAMRERPAGGTIQTFIRAGVRVVMTSRSVAIITLIVSNCRQENKNECIPMNGSENTQDTQDTHTQLYPPFICLFSLLVRYLQRHLHRCHSWNQY